MDRRTNVARDPNSAEEATRLLRVMHGWMDKAILAAMDGRSADMWVARQASYMTGAAYDAMKVRLGR